MPNAIIRSSLTLKWNALKPFFRPICVSRVKEENPIMSVIQGQTFPVYTLKVGWG